MYFFLKGIQLSRSKISMCLHIRDKFYDSLQIHSSIIMHFQFLLETNHKLFKREEHISMMNHIPTKVSRNSLASKKFRKTYFRLVIIWAQKMYSLFFYTNSLTEFHIISFKVQYMLIRIFQTI